MGGDRFLPGEPLGWRVGDIGTSFCSNNDNYILPLLSKA